MAAAVGITMFGETFRYGETGTVLALACGVVAAGGLILLTTEQIGSARNTAEVAASAAAQTEPAPEAATPDSALEALLLAALPEQSTGPDPEHEPTTGHREAFGAGFGEGFDAGLAESFDAKLGEEFDAGLETHSTPGSEADSEPGSGRRSTPGLANGLEPGSERTRRDCGQDVFEPAPAMVGWRESAPDPADSPEEDAPPVPTYFGPLRGPTSGRDASAGPPPPHARHILTPPALR